jgi:nitrogen regulatory protein P-II 1
MTVSEIHGRGHAGELTHVYRAVEYTVEYIARTKIEIVVPDEMVDLTIEAIERSARTGVFGKAGDGMIFVLPIHDAIRVRTGERGELAL